jgi:FkbM family methyltransferase
MILHFVRKLIRTFLPRSLAVKVANMYRIARNRRFQSRQIERLYRGHRLRLQISDAMAESWYDHDWNEAIPELDILCSRKLKRGATVFDIGAHQAVVALVMAREVGPEGKVIAVEAEAWNAKAAEINKALNRADNLTLILAAAADSLATGCDSADKLSDWQIAGVPRVTVDQLSSDCGVPDVVYVDVDGFDCHVLRGAPDTLQSEADWFVEVHVGAGLEDQGGSWQEVLSFFPSDRYQRLIASDHQTEFVPFDANSGILAERFFLLALRLPSSRTNH